MCAPANYEDGSYEVGVQSFSHHSARFCAANIRKRFRIVAMRIPILCILSDHVLNSATGDHIAVRFPSLLSNESHDR